MFSGTEQKKISRIQWLAVAFLFISAILSFVAVHAQEKIDGFARIHFLNVGQGDAIFIEAGGNQVLIDGGPDSKIIQELGRVMPFNDRTIDMLILTHPDSDHINGLIEVLKRYQVGAILENRISRSSPAYEEWKNLISGLKVYQAKSGQEIEVSVGVDIKILYPFDGSGEETKANNNSIVALLTRGENSLLLTGDIEQKIESKLILAGVDLDADFLKTPHHGSKTSTSKKFLDAVSPVLAFIQVGEDNSYGHPSAGVLKRLEDFGAKYYRTDIDGAVELVLDDENYKINK